MNPDLISCAVWFWYLLYPHGKQYFISSCDSVEMLLHWWIVTQSEDSHSKTYLLIRLHRHVFGLSPCIIRSTEPTPCMLNKVVRLHKHVLIISDFGNMWQVQWIQQWWYGSWWNNSDTATAVYTLVGWSMQRRGPLCWPVSNTVSSCKCSGHSFQQPHLTPNTEFAICKEYIFWTIEPFHTYQNDMIKNFAVINSVINRVNRVENSCLQMAFS